jgi:hypothetical protein
LEEVRLNLREFHPLEDVEGRVSDCPVAKGAHLEQERNVHESYQGVAILPLVACTHREVRLLQLGQTDSDLRRRQEEVEAEQDIEGDQIAIQVEVIAVGFLVFVFDIQAARVASLLHVSADWEAKDYIAVPEQELKPEQVE